MPYWRLFYHVVWGTKGREPLIKDDMGPSLYKRITNKAIQSGAIVHALGGTQDHVHLVASIPPGVALSEFVGQVKGISSHFANHELTLPFVFAWQAEYGVVSFGEKQLSTVVEYVRNQKEHHAQGDYNLGSREAFSGGTSTEYASLNPSPFRGLGDFSPTALASGGCRECGPAAAVGEERGYGDRPGAKPTGLKWRSLLKQAEVLHPGVGSPFRGPGNFSPTALASGGCRGRERRSRVCFP